MTEPDPQETCSTHRDAPAFSRCADCGAKVCEKCLRTKDDKTYCTLCASRTKSYDLGTNISRGALLSAVAFSAAIVFSCIVSSRPSAIELRLASTLALLVTSIWATVHTASALFRERRNFYRTFSILIYVIAIFLFFTPPVLFPSLRNLALVMDYYDFPPKPDPPIYTTED
jgi:hypothetical protein